MAKQRFQQSPFRDLNVSRRDREQLLAFADSFVERSFRQYEAFVASDGRAVRPAKWKHVRSRQELHVYVERGSGRFPLLLSVGHIPGQMEDLLLGVVSPSVDMMRVRAACVGPKLEDAAVLTPIVEPSARDPFRTVAVKWGALSRRRSSLLVKNRDLVVIEATGVLALANGERVGYHAVHSVEFPATKASRVAHNWVRARVALCSFFRQSSLDFIEVFATEAIDVSGSDLPRMVVVHSVADYLLQVAKYVPCGQMKKLLTTLQRRPDAPRLTGPAACVTCGKTRRSGVLGGLTDRRKSVCRLCFGVVCLSCRVRERIAFFTPSNTLELCKLSFCSRCLAAHALVDPQEVALAQAKSGFAGCRSFAGASFSAASSRA